MVVKKMKGKIAESLIISFIVSLVFNVFVCNFSFFRTRSYKESVIMLNETFSDTSVIKFSLKNQLAAKNIYLDFVLLDENDNENSRKTPVEFFFTVTDEGNKLPYSFEKLKLIPSVSNTKYIQINPMGDLTGLELNVVKAANEKIHIKNITINKPHPFKFYILWFFLILISVFLFLNLKYKSPLMNISFSDCKRSLNKFNIVFLCAILLICLTKPLGKGLLNGDSYEHYHVLTESLAKGHFYLDIPVSQELKNLSNPYDTSYRKSVIGDDYEWDCCFKDGKYYCYYGIVPTLLTFLPFYLITGKHLPLELSICIFSALFIIFLFLLLKKIFEKFFPSVKYLTFLLAYILFLNASGTNHAFQGNYFYSLPIISALAFCCMGLYFWFSVEESDGKLNYVKLAIGSFVLSLIAGCRPTLLITGFSFPFIFKDFLFDKEVAVSEKIKFLAFLIFPVIPFACFAMYYNYARFGSIFDFGANYNLTTNDMTHRMWHNDRIPQGIFTFLFEPSTYKTVFPFLYPSYLKSLYQGPTIYEGNYGGLLFNFPVLAACIIYSAKTFFKEKKFRYLKLFFILSSLLLVILDIQIAGLVGNRYKMDFAWLLCLNMIFVFGELIEKKNELLNKVLHYSLLISTFLSVVYVMLVYCATARSAAVIQALIQFW